MTARKKLINQIDKAFKAWMKKTYPLKCITCGTTDNLTWSHLITATKYATRWDKSNLTWQCASCNFRHEHYPEYYTSWFLNMYGKRAYDALVKRSWSREGKPYTITELRALLAEWTERAKS